jgi:hypothetical protein
LSSQIRYIVVIRVKSPGDHDDEFFLRSNIVYASSTKYKRVTRAILASELYAIVARVDILISITTIVNIVTAKLSLSSLATVVYTNSLSLYEYIVKLGTIKEKRLMIDIIAIR